MSKIEGKITVAEAISELLYQHDSVIVPKFGGFVKEYRASTFDYVQGKISPPSSTISFNENLKVDDGLLIDFYRKENQLSLQEAQEEIGAFSKKAKVTLSNKEVVSLPKIGRLLKDYENQTKFISQNHNFNTDTYGLSEVRYYPILREIPKNEENMPNAAAAVAAIPPLVKKKKRKSQRVAKIAIPIVICLMFFSAFLVFKNFKVSDELASEKAGIETDKDPTKMPVNIKPPSKEEENNDLSENNGIGEEIPYNDVDITTENETLAEAQEENITKEPENEATTNTTEKPETNTFEETKPEVDEPRIENSSTSNTDIIIYVGLFSKQSGVDKYTALIVANDWIPHTEVKRNGNTRVGVKVPEGVNPDYFLPKVKAKIAADAYY